MRLVLVRATPPADVDVTHFAEVGVTHFMPPLADYCRQNWLQSDSNLLSHRLITLTGGK